MKTKTIGLAIGLILMAGFASIASATAHVPTMTDEQPMQWFPGFEDGDAGTSYLTRSLDRVLLVVDARNLPDDAYTVWWVIFNDPTLCTPVDAPVCGEDDVFGEDAVANGISVVNATGGIARADGSATFGAVLNDAANGGTGDRQVLFGFGLDADNGKNAEIHIVIQGHGQHRGGGQLQAQTTLFEAGCAPVCADQQFAVHMP